MADEFNVLLGVQTDIKEVDNLVKQINDKVSNIKLTIDTSSITEALQKINFDNIKPIEVSTNIQETETKFNQSIENISTKVESMSHQISDALIKMMMPIDEKSAEKLRTLTDEFQKLYESGDATKMEQSFHTIQNAIESMISKSILGTKELDESFKILLQEIKGAKIDMSEFFDKESMMEILYLFDKSGTSIDVFMDHLRNVPGLVGMFSESFSSYRSDAEAVVGYTGGAINELEHLMLQIRAAKEALAETKVVTDDDVKQSIGLPGWEAVNVRIREIFDDITNQMSRYLDMPSGKAIEIPMQVDIEQFQQSANEVDQKVQEISQKKVDIPVGLEQSTLVEDARAAFDEIDKSAKQIVPSVEKISDSFGNITTGTNEARAAIEPYEAQARETAQALDGVSGVIKELSDFKIGYSDADANIISSITYEYKDQLDNLIQIRQTWVAIEGEEEKQAVFSATIADNEKERLKIEQQIQEALSKTVQQREKLDRKEEENQAKAINKELDRQYEIEQQILQERQKSFDILQSQAQLTVSEIVSKETVSDEAKTRLQDIIKSISEITPTASDAKGTIKSLIDEIIKIGTSENAFGKLTDSTKTMTSEGEKVTKVFETINGTVKQTTSVIEGFGVVKSNFKDVTKEIENADKASRLLEYEISRLKEIAGDKALKLISSDSISEEAKTKIYEISDAMDKITPSTESAVTKLRDLNKDLTDITSQTEKFSKEIKNALEFLNRQDIIPHEEFQRLNKELSEVDFAGNWQQQINTIVLEIGRLGIESQAAVKESKIDEAFEQMFGKISSQLTNLKAPTSEIIALMEKFSGIVFSGKPFEEMTEDLKKFSTEVANIGKQETLKQQITDLVDNILKQLGRLRNTDALKKFKDDLAGIDATQITGSTIVALNNLEGEIKKFADSAKQVDTLSLSIAGLQKKIDTVKYPEADAKKFQDRLNEINKAYKDGTVGAQGTADAIRLLGKEMSNSSGLASQFGHEIQRAVLMALGIGSVTMVVRQVVNEIRQMVSVSIELDNQMNKIRMVTGATTEQSNQMLRSYQQLASQLSATTKEVASSAEVWLRQGRSIEDTTKLIEASTILSKVGFLENAEASKLLTSALNGYKLEANEAIDVIDKLSAIDYVGFYNQNT